MLTDSIAPEVLFDLTCSEETLIDDSLVMFEEEEDGKENNQPIFQNHHFNYTQDKENNPNLQLFEHIQCMPVMRAGKDLNLLGDSRVLQNLLSAEDNFTSYPSTYKFQEDLKPHMRRTVAQWMLDVCDDQGVDEECFSLAVNYLDRVLTCHKTDRTKLQLIATACLFIASKVKEATPFNPHKLVAYTEHSISIEDLLEWEMLILQILKWDTCPIIAHDYLPYLVSLLAEKDIHDQVIRHAQTFISLCSAEFEFSLQPASVLACASVCIAVVGLSKGDSKCLETLHANMNEITNIDVECIKTCQEQIERLLNQHISMTNNENTMTTNNNTTNNNTTKPLAGWESTDDEVSHSFAASSSSSSSLSINTNFSLPPSRLSPSTTPTDVKDIML